MKRIVVVESPYAGQVDRNVCYARAAIRDCLIRGEAPFASHLLYTQPGVLEDGLREQRELGIEAGLVFHGVADAIVFYVDLGWSVGMRAANEQAVLLGKRRETRRLRWWNGSAE